CKKGRAEAVGKRIAERMEKLQKEVPLIGDVRGLGAMQAVELVRDRTTKEPAEQETKAGMALAREPGVLLLSAGPFGNVIRFTTPLTITDAELDEGLSVVEEAIRSAAKPSAS